MDDVPGKLVDVGIEVGFGAQRALEIRMSRLVALLSPELGNPHTVVIDQPQETVGLHENVAVLQITVSDVGRSQVLKELLPLFLELAELTGIRRDLLDELVQAHTLDPLHLDEGKLLALDPNPLFVVFECHKIGQAALFQVIRDLRIAVVEIGNIAEEALHGPSAPTSGLQLIDAGERAADRPRKMTYCSSMTFSFC